MRSKLNMRYKAIIMRIKITNYDKKYKLWDTKS